MMLNIRKISILGLLLSCSLTSLGSPICVASPTEAHRVLMTKNPFSDSTSTTTPAPDQQRQANSRVTQSPTTNNNTVNGHSNTVNINKADAATLARMLHGIGEKKAQAIIEYRQTHGAFTTIEQLDQVKGIGPATIAKNRERIRLQ